MKVHISYSVELEEVLENVSALVTREHNILKSKLKELSKTVTSEYTAKNLGEVVYDMKLYQESLKKMDLKLTEMTAILMGYQRLQHGEGQSPNAVPEDTPSE